MDRYVTKETWSYNSWGNINKPKFKVIPFDKNQWVEFLGYEDDDEKEPKIAKINYRGKLLYMNASALTSTKPTGSSYKATYSDRRITIAKDTTLYNYPSTSSQKRLVMPLDKDFNVICQTNKWYAIFYKGHTWYLKKDDPGVLGYVSKRYPKFTGVESATDDWYRLAYQIDMQDTSMIDLICDKGLIIDIQRETTLKDYKGNPYPPTVIGVTSYYTNRIYLKDMVSQTLEKACHHELGHYIAHQLGSKTDIYDAANMYVTTKAIPVSYSDSYAMSNATEFIGQMYKLYHTNYDALLKYCPRMTEAYETMFEAYRNMRK